MLVRFTCSEITMISKWILILLLPNICSKGEIQKSSPRVDINLGKIRGTIKTTLEGRTIYTFRGIRYGLPPIGERRFQPPEPVTEKWKYTYDASREMLACPEPFVNETDYSEDCLKLNVFTTKLPEKTGSNPKLPVIVYLFAGAYIRAIPPIANNGPEYLLDEDVVLVIPNYRIGALGFTSTGDKEAPGNNGLKDQVLALKWVQDNIEAFGGDPKSVTLMGYSAGSCSINIHLVSPLSKGLFHRGIMMSGSGMGHLPTPKGQMDVAKKLAKFLECPDDDSKKIMDCLKEKSTKALVDSFFKFLEFGYDPVAIWFPVIEPEGTKNAFLTKHPIESAKNGEFEKVPLLIGRNEYEFALFAFSVTYNEEWAKKMDKEYEKIFPISFLYPKENSTDISKQLRNFYFGDKPIDKSTVGSLEQIYSDAIIGYGTYRSARFFSQNNNNSVYYYNFDYKGRYSYFYLPDTDNKPYGAVHLDELIYLFHDHGIHTMFKQTDPEYTKVKQLTKMWTNFAKTGNPTPEQVDLLENLKWEPYKIDNKNYLHISDKLVMKKDLNAKRYELWDKLFGEATNNNL